MTFKNLLFPVLNTFWNKEKAAVTAFLGNEPLTLVGDGRISHKILGD